MSLILDALKKAEAERQRQSGPTLLEVRVSQPPRRLPLWMWIIGGLLAGNMILLLVFALRRPAMTAAAPQAAAAAPTAPTAVAPAAAPASTPASATAASALPSAALAEPATPTAAPPAVAPPAVAAAAAAPLAVVPPAGVAATSDHNPADDEPAVPARNRPTGRTEPLPNLGDLEGDMPNLRLDLHVYSDRPASRYALINMHTVHEGDVLPEGPTVIEIYRDGVELSYRGTQFMLRPQ